MEAGGEVWEARKHLAWGNTTVALFSFCAASLVFLTSYLGVGVEVEGDSLFAESRTAVLILLLLVVIQSVYFYLVSRRKLKTTTEMGSNLLDMENTYFIAFASLAAALVYGISVLGHISDSLSALAAASILAVFFVIQFSYLTISERRGRKK